MTQNDWYSLLDVLLSQTAGQMAGTALTLAGYAYARRKHIPNINDPWSTILCA